MILKNDEYYIQNFKLTDLAAEFGTPLYLYDGNIIEEKVKRLKNAFSQINMKIKYACKANTNISVLKLMKNLGVELDVVSPQELQLGLIAGFSPENITFTSSGVGFEEIEESVENGVIVNIDNLPTLEKFGIKYGSTQPVLIRIRPNVEGGGNQKISTGHKDSKFGIAIEQVEQILALQKKYNLNILGIHQHTGSDIKDGSTFVEVANVVFEFAKSFKGLKYIDLGGGFKVPYKKGDHETDMEDLGVKLSAAFQNFCKEYGADLELWFEPGKYLVSECGILLASANVVKENPGKTLIGLNTGLNHLIRPMMYDAYHKVVNISNTSDSKQKYNVVGYICETDDIAKDRSLSEARDGDLFAILNAGAYGFTMASNYNSRLKPAEVLIYKNQKHLIRERQTLQDIINKQILIDFDYET
ncbi:MAG: diaminopimelate decarboxylase [Cytophagaceae bacterium]|nr:diaminopimelate decarboxylase [Cytophagaceae bacterium]MBL0326843.1 diaminopimelate decarboxylase [Cytophagaceae bacterium]